MTSKLKTIFLKIIKNYSYHIHIITQIIKVGNIFYNCNISINISKILVNKYNYNHIYF